MLDFIARYPARTIYADAIVEGMQSCSACAVLVSAASNASKAVKREVELASHEDKDLIRSASTTANRGRDWRIICGMYSGSTTCAMTMMG